jgi:beta-galactosidase
MRKVLLSFVLVIFILISGYTQNVSHTFSFRNTDFLLDGNPYQLIAGEMHPARIPAEYWHHRIQMAKAMGCNTIAAYIFWNYHETGPGVYDFKTGNHNLAQFIRLAAQEGLWVILRPGPYVCAEWDFGGIPPYLLKIPDIKVRCMDERYMLAAGNYMKALAAEIKPLLITNGGPVLMLQVENEYGSYGNDQRYMKQIKKIWEQSGIDVPFFTGDGPTTYMLEAGSLPGCAVGLDSGSDQGCFDLAYKTNPGVPVFSSETYPGWLTHWGEPWVRPDTAPLLKEVRFLMDTKKSFNLYVIHGGTNFGFTAGANSGGKGYEPDVTSYDYDAPVDEQGNATPKYLALRKLIGSYLPSGQKLPEIPEPIKTISFPPVQMQPFTSIWENLPESVGCVQPVPFESLDQNQGLMLYRTTLIGHKSGKLKITELHDYATVFVDGNYIGKLDRREGNFIIELPKTTSKNPILEILVEGMGHINFAQEIIDRKGITDRVTLNGMTLMNWEVFKLPLSDEMISALNPGVRFSSKPGLFFKGTIVLQQTGDVYVDLSGYKKGVVWMNGHNLGRFWDIGPQKRLYCPASWLNTGENEILIFDLHQTQARPVEGFKMQNQHQPDIL